MSDVTLDVLVTSHMPLAEILGARCSRIPTDDGKQEAMVGLIMAARRFSPDRGVKFSTFAATVIRNHLLNAVAVYSPLPMQPEERIVEEHGEEEEVEAVRSAMSRLMPEVRTALEMRYGGESEATFEEIGLALGCSHTTARATVAAGLVKLKGMLEP